jgi:hypothetical protein
MVPEDYRWKIGEVIESKISKELMRYIRTYIHTYIEPSFGNRTPSSTDVIFSIFINETRTSKHKMFISLHYFKEF